MFLLYTFTLASFDNAKAESFPIALLKITTTVSPNCPTEVRKIN